MTGPVTLPDDWFPRPLPANAEIGEGCYIHSAYSFLHYRSERPCGMRIGRATGVYFETFFEIGPDGYVEVGDFCTLAGPVICTNSRVIIGSHVLVSREVIMADDAAAVPPPEAGGRCSVRDPVTKDEIVVGDNAWIGTRAILLGGARLGEGVIVGAGSVVGFEVPAFAIVAGNPARVVGWARPKDSQT